MEQGRFSCWYSGRVSSEKIVQLKTLCLEVLVLSQLYAATVCVIQSIGSV